MPRASKAKKLVLVLATFASVTSASKEAQITQVTHKEKEVILNWVLYIYYPVQFRKNKGETIQALIDSGSEVIAMTPTYAKQLGLWTQKTDVGVQKIDRSSLDKFGMVIIDFQVLDKQGRTQFF